MVNKALYPEPQLGKILDPDPHAINADPKPRPLVTPSLCCRLEDPNCRGANAEKVFPGARRQQLRVPPLRPPAHAQGGIPRPSHRRDESQALPRRFVLFLYTTMRFWFRNWFESRFCMQTQYFRPEVEQIKKFETV